MNGLEGKSVIVTGGASGIGRAAVQLLSEAGCSITIADLNEAGGDEVVGAIRASGRGKGHFIRTDVSDEASVEAMVESATAAYGRLDGAINAAGVPQRGRPLADLTIEDWDRCHLVNLRGMFLCIKYQVLAMQRTGGGSIVAIASSAAVTGVPNGSDYCASKAGVTGLVRGGAVDYAEKGVRINAILPGGTWTPMVQHAIERDPALKRIVEKFPMKRFAQPNEIAAGAVWLVSDGASYVTGASWTIDGALTII